jgi:RND family efflux transporter MFP subunit
MNEHTTLQVIDPSRRPAASVMGRARPTVAALVGLAALAALAGCNRGNAADAKADAGPPTATVGPENIAVVVSARLATGPAISGALQAEREATVRAEVGGPVLQTYVDQGSRVSSGTLLARLDDAALQDAMLSARSAFTSAKTASDLATRELDRQQKLYAAGAVAERDVDDARRANEAAQAQLADARARLTLAQDQLADARVQAPFTGLVATRHVSSGDVVQPGAAMFTIVDPTSMRLEASVPASQLNAVKVGAPVTFTVSGYPGRTFSGKVTRINPTVDPATGQLRIVASIPNASSGLVAGLFADGRVESATRDGMVVPVNAVDARGVRPWVLRLNDGKAERREVEIGIRDDQTERVEILSGVSPGDTLLVGAAQGISNGTIVRVSTGADSRAAEAKN